MVYVGGVGFVFDPYQLITTHPPSKAQAYPSSCDTNVTQGSSLKTLCVARTRREASWSYRPALDEISSTPPHPESSWSRRTVPEAWRENAVGDGVDASGGSSVGPNQRAMTARGREAQRPIVIVYRFSQKPFKKGTYEDKS
jgi:hypothetical protein